MKQSKLTVIIPEPEEKKEPGRKPQQKLTPPFFANAVVDCSEPRYLKQTMAELKKTRPAKVTPKPSFMDKVKRIFKK